VQSKKSALASFWTPSVTPTSNTNKALHEVKKKTKTQPICPGSAEDKPHPYSLHSLITINFTEEEVKTAAAENKNGGSGSRGPQRICPACKKVLSNASKAVLAKPCGHVLCKSCVGKFMQPTGRHDPHAPDENPHALQCYVCEADLTDTKPPKKEGKEKIRPGLVDLRSEGTGFSAGGVNQVKKSGVTFQC
jgi:nitric oxide synthase-interacting protein